MAWGVLGARLQMGDERRFASAELRRRSGLACPVGCLDVCGKPALFSWAHVQFFCQGCSLLGLRRTWLQHMMDATEVVDGGGAEPNDDWRRAKGLAAGGLPHALQANREGAVPIGSAGELALRRVVALSSG